MHVFYVDVIQWMKINNFRDLAGPNIFHHFKPNLDTFLFSSSYKSVV